MALPHGGACSLREPRSAQSRASLVPRLTASDAVHALGFVCTLGAGFLLLPLNQGQGGRRTDSLMTVELILRKMKPLPSSPALPSRLLPAQSRQPGLRGDRRFAQPRASHQRQTSLSALGLVPLLLGHAGLLWETCARLSTTHFVLFFAEVLVSDLTLGFAWLGRFFYLCLLIKGRVARNCLTAEVTFPGPQ